MGYFYHSLKSISRDIVLVMRITAIAVATSSTQCLVWPHLTSLALTLVWYQAFDDYDSNEQNDLDPYLYRQSTLDLRTQ